MPTKLIGKCRTCKKVVTIPDYEALKESDSELYWQIDIYKFTPCACGWTMKFRKMTTQRGARECGAWCTDGTGRKCTCVCEGRNHSSRYSHTGALWYAR
jgi:hypothetical protein